MQTEPSHSLEVTDHRPWNSLPPLLLSKCLRGRCPRSDREPNSSHRDDFAALATCRGFAKAMLTCISQLTVLVNDFKPSVAAVLRWTAESDARLAIRLWCRREEQPPSIRPLWSLLEQEGVRLRNVHRILCLGLLLDFRDDFGLADVFPNLTKLELRDCQVNVGMLPLSGCTNLQHLALRCSHPVAVSDASAWLYQLQQLAGLPSLTALTVQARQFPTSFLPLWTDHLTELHLHPGADPLPLQKLRLTDQVQPASDEQQLFGVEQPADAVMTSQQMTDNPQTIWQAALRDVAHLRNLRWLELGPCSPEELGMLTPLSGHLQDLQMSPDGLDWDKCKDADGLLSTLLKFTHLTRLSSVRMGDLKHSYADRPCAWRRLRLGRVSPLTLSRLPMHSLNQPLRLRCLDLSGGATSPDVVAAVANLGRGQASSVLSWASSHIPADRQMDICFALPGLEELQSCNNATALLRAAAPLVAQDATGLTVIHCGVEAALVIALQHAAPDTLTTLRTEVCHIDYSFWPQVARSFPLLEHICCDNPLERSPAVAIMGYFCVIYACWHAAQQQAAQAAQAAETSATAQPHQPHLPERQSGQGPSTGASSGSSSPTGPRAMLAVVAAHEIPDGPSGPPVVFALVPVDDGPIGQAPQLSEAAPVGGTSQQQAAPQTAPAGLPHAVLAAVPVPLNAASISIIVDELPEDWEDYKKSLEAMNQELQLLGLNANVEAVSPFDDA